VATVPSSGHNPRLAGLGTVRFTLSEEEAAEERRLWADYYEAMARVLEIMRREGTAGGALSRIAEEDAIASRAIARIKEIHRMGEPPGSERKKGRDESPCDSTER